MRISERIKTKTKELLEKAFNEGIVFWECPFLKVAILNHGYNNKNAYSGMNAVLTHLSKIVNSYKSYTWLTYGCYKTLQKGNPEMKINKILINDKKGETVATNNNLETFDTIEVFVEAYKQEIIDEDDLKKIVFIAERNAQYLPVGFAEELENIPYEYGKGLQL